MSNIRNWNLFLEHIAKEFELNLRQAEVFKVRFTWENKAKTDREIAEFVESSLFMSESTYIKTKSEIYHVFTNAADGYPKLKNCDRKYQELRQWLEQKYGDRLKTYNPPQQTPYIERKCEAQCYGELLEPRAFVRLRASRKMGKTAILSRVLTEFSSKGLTALRFNFSSLEQAIFQDYEKFCHSFCAGVSEQLNLGDRLTEFWNHRLGCNQNTTRYFERYILATVEQPLILGLDGLDCIFEHKPLAENFCKLLRSWQENHRDIWTQLRLIVVHSTDVYSGLDINSSPLAGIGKVFFYPH